MSSDGIRKPTLTWDNTIGGGTSRGGGQVIKIDDAPQVSASIPIDSGAIVIDEPPAPPAPPVQRQRRSTLDTFNDEMSVLERPIEGDVEYIDEKPPTRWRHITAFMATVAIVGGGGAFMLSRHHQAIAAQDKPSLPAAVAVAVAPAASPPIAAAEPAAAPAAPAGSVAAVAAAPAPAEDDSGDDDAQPAAAAPSAWGKVKSQSGHAAHGKHARAVSGKAGHHRVKHAAASKHGAKH